MNRFATRLLLAMLVTAVISLTVVPVAQVVATRLTFERLNADFRARVYEHTRPPPFPFDDRRRLTPSTPPAVPGVQAERFLFEENTRLFILLGDFRAALRQSVLVGVVLALAIAVALALWLSRGIARPIEAVSRAASRLAGGALETRVDGTRTRDQPDELRQLAADFNAMAAALERYEGERKAMIADIAHELRTPLATLQFRLDALEDGVVRLDEAEVRLLKQHTGLLARLIEDLRVLSLADAGRLSLQLRHVDLVQLLTGIVETYQDRARRQDVRLGLRDRPPEAWVEADPDRLTQVMHNLLDNALRVTPGGGWIEVELGTTESEATLTVRDSGPGIAEDEIGTIFERFTQGKRRDVRSQQGSGLGLAIVKEIVTLHGGRVSARNHAEGAQFEVTLRRPETPGG